MAKLVYPPYEKGVNYFKLVCDFENKFLKHEYTTHSPEEVWGHRGKPIDDIFFYRMFCHNLAKGLKNKDLKEEMLDFKKINSNTDDSKHLYAMITVGWNEQTITPTKMLSVSQNILNLKYFKTAFMVLEKHRENGIHHHTHYLVEFVEKYPVSKVLGWIYQTRGVKQMCLNKNFIDYLGPQNGKKPYQTYADYFKYINGDKQESKLKYCEDDKIWRKANGILDLYSKD